MMRTLRLLAYGATLALSCFSPRAHAQDVRTRGDDAPARQSSSFGLISGRVVAAETGEPLAGAQVIATSTQGNQPMLGAVVNLEGNFTIQRVPEGRYELRITYLGYTQSNTTVDVVGGQAAQVNVRLQPSNLQLKEVIISGSLEGQARALNQQKNADNIKTIVSADQIGRFPDLNVAEALQRVSGISITRDNGEGSAVQIRGTPRNFTTISINGEQMPSTDEGGNRAEALDLVPADQLASMEITKSVTPDQDGDAIGGAVNLITPFARKDKPRIKLDLSGGYNRLLDRSYSNGSGGVQLDFGRNVNTIGRISYDQRFFSERLGVLVTGTYYRTLNGEDRAEYEYRPGPAPADGYAPELVRQLPQLLIDHALRDAQNTRTRAGLTSTIDYRFNDVTQVYFKFIYSSLEDDNIRRRVRYRPQVPTRFDSDTVGNAFAGYRTPDTTQNDARVRRDVNDRVVKRENWSLNFGANHTWGKVKLDYEVFYTQSLRRLNSFRNTFGLPNVTWAVDRSDPDYPKYTFLPNPTYPTGVDQFEPTGYQFVSTETDVISTTSKNLVFKTNLQMPVELAGGSGFIKVGVKYRQIRNRRTRNLDTYDNIIGGVANYRMSQVVGNYDDLNYLNGNYRLGLFPEPLRLRQYFETNQALFVRNGTASFFQSEAFFYDAVEDVVAGYAMGRLNWSKLMVMAGLRIEGTSVNYQANFVNRAAGDTTLVPRPGSNNYPFILPNLQMRYALDENTNLRFAALWTFSRPNFLSVVPFEDIIIADFEIRRGNPGLRATNAFNLDLMIERYFASVGVISAGVFYKDISNFIFERRSQEFVAGQLYQAFTPVNGDQARIFGFELVGQRQLDFLPGFLSGLGVYANYTFTTSSSDVGARTNVRFPGQSSHVWNAALTYDRGGFSARASLNYNSSFILRITDDPTFDDYVDSRLQLDINVSQSFLDRKMRVYCELINLTNQPRREYRGVTTLPINLEFYSWWMRLGVSYRLN